MSMTIRQHEYAKRLLVERGFAYADGFFSTMAVCHGQILWKDYHWQRLLNHASVLSLSLDMPKLTQQLSEHAMDLNEGIVKVVVSRMPQPVRGYGWVTDDSMVDIMVSKTPILSQIDNQFFALPMQPVGDAICLCQKIACLPVPLVGLKSLNRLDSVLVASELEQHKKIYPTLVEGLVQDVMGNWIEGVVSNVFYRLAHPICPWYTPPIDQSGVSGVMRQVVMDTLHTKGQTVIERKLTNIDLSNLSAVFFCNAVRGIMPIARLQKNGKWHQLDTTIYC